MLMVVLTVVQCVSCLSSWLWHFLLWLNDSS